MLRTIEHSIIVGRSIFCRKNTVARDTIYLLAGAFCRTAVFGEVKTVDTLRCLAPGIIAHTMDGDAALEPFPGLGRRLDISICVSVVLILCQAVAGQQHLVDRYCLVRSNGKINFRSADALLRYGEVQGDRCIFQFIQAAVAQCYQNLRSLLVGANTRIIGILTGIITVVFKLICVSIIQCLHGTHSRIFGMAIKSRRITGLENSPIPVLYLIPFYIPGNTRRKQISWGNCIRYLKRPAVVAIAARLDRKIMLPPASRPRRQFRHKIRSIGKIRGNTPRT